LPISRNNYVELILLFLNNKPKLHPMKFLSTKNLTIYILLALPAFAAAQSTTTTNGSGVNAIPTAVPFLLISRPIRDLVGWGMPA
jgi:hypothetical protein